MDVTAFLELKPAPRVVFDDLPKHRTRPRFMIPTANGDWRALTWAAYARMIREVALFLAAEGLKTNDRAVIFAPNRVEWIAAALGIQAASGVMVPIYASSTSAQAAYIAEHSEARFVFVDTEALLERIFESWSSYSNVHRIVCLDDAINVSKAVQNVRARGLDAPSFSERDRRVISWSRATELGAARDDEQPHLFPQLLESLSLEQTAIMLYTSGTTGNPKGVPLTHRNIATNTRDWLKAVAPQLDEGAVDLLWLPMSHIFGYGEAGIGNLLGFTSYLAAPQDVIAKLSEVRPSVLMSVPSYWEKLAAGAAASDASSAPADPAKRREKLRELTGGNLRFCLSGGAGLKREVKELFHESGILIIEGYGLTETSPTLTINRPDAFRFDSVGKPLASVELKLAEDGEILARGPSVFAGYHRDPAATQGAFTEDGWFKTGDVGRMTDDGFLQIVDRKKDILVTAGGKNVPPANIEVRFRDDPFLAHVVVYGDAKHYLVAGVWLNTAAVEAHLRPSQLTAGARTEAIRALVQQRIDRVNAELASWERIKRFAIVDRALTIEDGFLTPTLKIRRKKIYEAFAAEFEGAYA